MTFGSMCGMAQLRIDRYIDYYVTSSQLVLSIIYYLELSDRKLLDFRLPIAHATSF